MGPTFFREIGSPHLVVFGDRRNIIIPIYGYDLLFPVYNLTPQHIWKGVFLIKDPTAQI